MPHKAIMKKVASLSSFVRMLGAEDLPIVVCQDPDFDETVVDFTDCETVTMTQKDERGTVHTIILSAKIMDQYAPYMLLWKSQNEPPHDNA